MGITQDEKLFIQIVRDFLNYETQGNINEFFDDEITMTELEGKVDKGALITTEFICVNKSMTKDKLMASPIHNQESKHLIFLGDKLLSELIEKAVLLSEKKSKGIIALLENGRTV